MPDEQLEKLWRNAANWTGIGFYRCADDPRWLVPKRNGGGWTVNVAQQRAVWSIVAMILATQVPIVIVLSRQNRPPNPVVLWVVGITVAMTIGAILWAAFREP